MTGGRQGENVFKEPGHRAFTRAFKMLENKQVTRFGGVPEGHVTTEGSTGSGGDLGQRGDSARTRVHRTGRRSCP